MQKEWKWLRCLPRYIRQRSWGRLRVNRKELAAAALLLLCFWGIFYPEFMLPADVCRKADGSALEAEDYEEVLNPQKGELQVTFSFLEQKPEKRTEDLEKTDAEKHREDDEVGNTGIQGKAHRGV